MTLIVRGYFELEVFFSGRFRRFRFSINRFGKAHIFILHDFVMWIKVVFFYRRFLCKALEMRKLYFSRLFDISKSLHIPKRTIRNK